MRLLALPLAVSAACAALFLSACESRQQAPAAATAPTVGVVEIGRHPLKRDLTLSSELVPFQEIDVFAKESGYVSKLLVDYGSRVKKGQLLAVLEIPELQMQLDQDRAEARSKSEEIANAEHQLNRTEAQHQVLHLQYQRFSSVAQSKPGLVAQQEVDDVQARDLASEAQVEAARANVEMAKSTLTASQARIDRDQALAAYARITAPFDGLVTQRYANLGTLVAAGTNSSTQAMPIVKLSQVDLFRLVIPVPEEYVRYVRLGEPVNVMIPSLNKTFPGRVARFSSDVHDATRTMHTEVDVLNPGGALMPGLYAEATISLNDAPDAVTVPLQAVDREGETTTVHLIGAQSQVVVRPVKLGIQTESEAEVLSGLQPSDKVVVSDRAGLNPGEQVKAQATTPISYNSKS